MSWISDHEFEPMVREALQARPEPRSISNLAYRAMEIARQQARALARRQLEGLIRLRRRTIWVGWISAALIAIVMSAEVMKLTDAGTANYSTTSVSSEHSASDSSSPATVLTGEMLVVAIILLSVRGNYERPPRNPLE